MCSSKAGLHVSCMCGAEYDYLPINGISMCGSVLKMLEEQGYEYLHSTLMCDWECLAAGGALMEASFCAPALYAMDNHGANMAMQVVRAAGDTLARSHNSVVASAPVGPALCSVNIALTDLQTGSTHSVIARQLKEGAVTSCTSRYLYKLASLGRMLTGPAAFKPKVHTVAPSSYLSLDQADITSMPAARAVAVLGKLKGPNPQAEVLSKEWLRDFAPTLAAQDALPGFRARLAGSSTPKRSPPGPSSAPPPPAARRLLLFVKDNQASRNAYKLARHMMAQDRTQLTLVHVVGPAASMTSGEALLASFTDVLTNDQTRRKVVQQVRDRHRAVRDRQRSVVPSGALCADLLSHGGGWRLQSERLMESLLSEVALLDPLLVILGSEALSSPSASSSASVGLQLAKSLFDCSLVIVKNNSCGGWL
ncbi:hypothetical protein QJQ45_023489 [Haematococcus lacustris]|nr:hypothetical protein QJQ45_023489 [Haematococcus lacustris]